jgi:hypothetical protein
MYRGGRRDEASVRGGNEERSERDIKIQKTIS